MLRASVKSGLFNPWPKRPFLKKLPYMGLAIGVWAMLALFYNIFPSQALAQEIIESETPQAEEQETEEIKVRDPFLPGESVILKLYAPAVDPSQLKLQAILMGFLYLLLSHLVPSF